MSVAGTGGANYRTACACETNWVWCPVTEILLTSTWPNAQPEQKRERTGRSFGPSMNATWGPPRFLGPMHRAITIRQIFITLANPAIKPNHLDELPGGSRHWCVKPRVGPLQTVGPAFTCRECDHARVPSGVCLSSGFGFRFRLGPRGHTRSIEHLGAGLVEKRDR